MRSLKSGLIALAISSVFGVAAVVGCSADGSTGTIDDTSGTDPNAGTPPGNVLPPENPGNPPAPPGDAGKDSGKKDSGVDAGPPPPNPGDPCPTQDKTAKKSCGKCGSQEAICQPKNGADGGALVWSDYGPCEGEDTTATACVPGTTSACGNCGTQTCSKYCQPSACSEPPGACKTGSLDYTSAGCSTPNTYRNRSCDATCKWSGFSGTCAAPNNPNKMQIPTTVNGTNAATWTFSAANVGSRLEEFGTCPGTVYTFGGPYPFVAVEIQNTTAQTATFSLQTDRAPGSTKDIDTVVWAYKKTLPPTDDASMIACDYGVTDECPTGGAIACPSYTYWGGIDAISLNPGTAILVYFAAYSATSTGDFSVKLKTTKLM